MGFQRCPRTGTTNRSTRIFNRDNICIGTVTASGGKFTASPMVGTKVRIADQRSFDLDEKARRYLRDYARNEINHPERWGK